MSKHTPEPWKSKGCVIRKDGFFEGKARDNAYIGECDAEENSVRIVACVNACAGMENPAEEIAKLRADKARLIDALRKLTTTQEYASEEQELAEQLLTEMEAN